MSRIGKTPINIPNTTAVSSKDKTVSVTGPKGTLTFEIPHGIELVMKDQVITVVCKKNDRKSKALHGLVRAHVDNMIHGVTEGWSKTLELSGVGYRAVVSNADLILSVGFSHQVTVKPPEGITFTMVEGKIVVSGIDKQVVGQAAADIRIVKKPEPYKGKGIRYQGEHVRKKAGKSAKSVGGAPGAA